MYSSFEKKLDVLLFESEMPCASWVIMAGKWNRNLHSSKENKTKRGDLPHYTVLILHSLDMWKWYANTMRLRYVYSYHYERVYFFRPMNTMNIRLHYGYNYGFCLFLVWLYSTLKKQKLHLSFEKVHLVTLKILVSSSCR